MLNLKKMTLNFDFSKKKKHCTTYIYFKLMKFFIKKKSCYVFEQNERNATKSSSLFFFILIRAIYIFFYNVIVIYIFLWYTRYRIIIILGILNFDLSCESNILYFNVILRINNTANTDGYYYFVRPFIFGLCNAKSFSHAQKVNTILLLSLIRRLCCTHIGIIISLN